MNISADVSIVTNASAEPAAVRFHSVAHFLNALHTLVNTWSSSGLKEVDSKRNKGEKVREADDSRCRSYYALVATYVLSHPALSEAARFAWALDRDKTTRIKAMGLHNEGLPWGEALIQASETLAVLWSSGGANSAAGVLPVWVGMSKSRAEQPERTNTADRVARGSIRSTGALRTSQTSQ